MAEKKERTFGIGNSDNIRLFYYAETMPAYGFRRFVLLVSFRFFLAIFVTLASPGGAQALTICIDEPAPGVVLHPLQNVSVEWHSPDYSDAPEQQQPQMLILQWEDVRTGEIIDTVNVIGDSLPMGSETLQVPTQINDRDEIRLTAKYIEFLWDPSSVIPSQAERILRVYRQSELALWLNHPNPQVAPGDTEDACANPLVVRPGHMPVYWGMSGCDPYRAHDFLNISYSIDREPWELIKRVDEPCSPQYTTWDVPNRLSDDVRLRLEWHQEELVTEGPPGLLEGRLAPPLAIVETEVPFSIHSETNSPPFARIVPETQSVLSQETVYLNGCESTDAEGDDINYEWNRGTDIFRDMFPGLLNNRLSCSAFFIAPPVNETQERSAVLSFNLRVTDDEHPDATLGTQQAVTLITVRPNPDDPDGDEINSSSGDNCPDVANLDQNDSDGDGFGDVCDNCRSVSNNQDDSDGDGLGDLCDICPNDAQNDIDSDLICGDVDLCPEVPDDGSDFDNDGEGDACDCDDGLRGPKEVGADCGGDICTASCEDEGECRSLIKSGLPESKFNLVLLIGDDYRSTYPNYAEVYGAATRDAINMVQQTYLADPDMGSVDHRDKYNLWYIRDSDYIVELNAKAECVAGALNAGADCTDNFSVCRDGNDSPDPTLCSTAVCDAGASNAGVDCTGNSSVCLDSTGTSDRTLCTANFCYWNDVGWNNICGHGEVAVILHNQVCRDKSIGEEFSSEPTSIGTFLHETGHALFDLGDEYDDSPDCTTDYHSTVPIENSNIWDSEADCRAHTSLTPDDCDPTDTNTPFTSCQGDWWKAQLGRVMMAANCWWYPNRICTWGDDAARQVDHILDSYHTPKMPEQALLGYFHFDGEAVTLRGFKSLTSRWPNRKVRRSSGLLFVLRNLAGEMLEDFTIRDPRYIHYLDPPLGGQLLDKTDFNLVLPYRDDASELVIRDIETKRVLGRFDLTRVLPPVCLDNPDDPACRCAGDLDKDRDVDRDDLTLFARGYANCSPSIDLSRDGKVSPPDLKQFAEDLGKIHCPDDEIEKCDDGNQCTRDYFDPITQVCVNEPKYCFDGLRCTIDSCDPQTGSCVFTPKDCDEGRLCTIDSCDPLTGKCQHDNKDCDDGNACTSETCDPVTGKCIFHEINCADKNSCTVDQCDSTVGCFHINLCDDNNPCTIDICDARLSTCTHKPDPKCQVAPHHYLEKKLIDSESTTGPSLILEEKR